MGGLWPMIYVVKKGHAWMGHIFPIADAPCLVLQRPLCSLYVLLPATRVSTRQCLSSAVLAHLTSSFDPAFLSDLRGLSWSSTGSTRVLGVGWG
jgi:hypothetical protein